MSKLTEHLNIEAAVKALTGRKAGLRPSKPGGNSKDNGLMQYVWRMCRFHAGHDLTMPMSCTFDLQNWCDAKFGEKALNFLYSKKEEDKVYQEELDKFVDDVLAKMGYDSNRAAKAYKGLLY